MTQLVSFIEATIIDHTANIIYLCTILVNAYGYSTQIV